MRLVYLKGLRDVHVVLVNKKTKFRTCIISVRRLNNKDKIKTASSNPFLINLKYL